MSTHIEGKRKPYTYVWTCNGCGTQVKWRKESERPAWHNLAVDMRSYGLLCSECFVTRLDALKSVELGLTP